MIKTDFVCKIDHFSASLWSLTSQVDKTLLQMQVILCGSQVMLPINFVDGCVAFMAFLCEKITKKIYSLPILLTLQCKKTALPVMNGVYIKGFTCFSMSEL